MYIKYKLQSSRELSSVIKEGKLAFLVLDNKGQAGEMMGGGERGRKNRKWRGKGRK